VHGVVANQSSATLTYPSVSAYLLNAGGQPLTRLTAVSDTSLAGYADWTFETNGFTEPFTTANVDMVVSYSVY
jgi:hypothetical protein